MFAAVFVSLFCFTSAWKWGPCPKYGYQPDFDLEKYLGEWREAARIKGIPFESGECEYANYSVRDDGLVKVNNTEILEDGSFKSAIGKAYQRKINPAALRVSFYGPFYFGTYNVVETDYEDYSVVYSCQNFYLFHTEFAWILTRNNNYEVDTAGQLDTLAELGIDKSEMMIHDLSACPAEV